MLGYLRIIVGTAVAMLAALPASAEETGGLPQIMVPAFEKDV